MCFHTLNTVSLGTPNRRFVAAADGLQLLDSPFANSCIPNSSRNSSFNIVLKIEVGAPTWGRVAGNAAAAAATAATAATASDRVAHIFPPHLVQLLDTRAPTDCCARLTATRP